MILQLRRQGDQFSNESVIIVMLIVNTFARRMCHFEGFMKSFVILLAGNVVLNIWTFCRLI